MAEYQPPTENLPIFDVTVFRNNDNPYGDIYLARTGIATSEAIIKSFSGEVDFNNLATPPHCSATPLDGNDLANKAYVDSQAPLTSYIVYLNYTETFTTSTPTVYKKLNPDENYTPTSVAIATTNTTPVLIAGFFNTKAALLFSDTIPPGNWNLVLYANCATIADQNHLELNYALVGVSAGGVETIIYTSAYSNSINVVAPSIGTYSCNLTIPSTSILAYTQIGIKVYVKSNTGANRNATIFFQYTSSYSSLQTSFGTTQASNILTTNNTWTGINTFTNTSTFNGTTNLNSPIIQSGTITFPDATTQSTAFKSLTAGTFTNTNIVVDSDGAISSIVTGTTPSTNAATIDLTLTTTGTSYFIPYSATTGSASTLLAGGLGYDRTNNFLSANCTNATNLRLGTAGQIPYQSAPTTTAFVAVGTSGQVLRSNATGAPTWTNDILGNSATSTAVALTSDDTSGDWFIPFSKTTSTTSNPLFIDDTTTPLTYNPSTGTLSSTRYTIGSSLQTTGTNSSIITQTTTNTNYNSNATAGQHRFNLFNASNVAVNPFNISSTALTGNVPMTLFTTVSNITPSFTTRDTVSNKRLSMLMNAGVAAYNSIVQAGDSVLFGVAAAVDTEILTLTTQATLSGGVRITPTSAVIGSGGSGTSDPANRITINGTAGTLGLVALNCPTQTGYTAPAGSDNTSNIATTAWVQTAIPLGTSALATNVSGGVIGNILYQASAGSTTRMTNGAAGTILTSGGVGAIPTWSSSFSGNAATATKALLSNTATGATNYLVMSSTNTGNSDLLTDTSGATYDSTTNTAVLNVTGNSVTTTNVSGGVIGNVLYQASAGSTTRMTNGAAGTVLTSGGVGVIPTWSNTFSGTATTATNAVNSGITNDLVSATSHALTFVSNTTGNLPLKTRANVSTGEGLTYIPSTNTLNCNIGGVGVVSTNTVSLVGNTAATSDIIQSGTTLFIRNSTPNDSINLQTADTGTGILQNRLVIGETTVVAHQRIFPRAGIMGPPTAITYLADMIGYSTQFNGNGANAVTTSLTWYAVTVTGFTFPAAGVYLVHMDVQATTSAAAGNIIFCNGGLSSTSAVAPTGVGSFETSFNKTSCNTPAIAGYAGGNASWVSTITVPATVYYFNVRWQNTTTVITLARTASIFRITRIA